MNPTVSSIVDGNPAWRAEIFTGGLRVIEDAARTIGGVEVVNVCLRKPDVQRLRAGQPRPAAQPHQHRRRIRQPPCLPHL